MLSGLRKRFFKNLAKKRARLRVKTWIMILMSLPSNDKIINRN